jgi:hypothetical protein
VKAKKKFWKEELSTKKQDSILNFGELTDTDEELLT